MTKAIIWTRDGIRATIGAVNAAKDLGYEVELRNISKPGPNGADAFRAAYPDVKTLPLIVIEGEFTGTLEQFKSTNSEKISAKAASVSIKAKKESVAAKAATKAAISAHKEERVAAVIAAKTAGTQAERHAAKASDKARNTARLKSLTKPANVVKDGDREYIQGAPKDAPAAHHEARHAAAKAQRAEARTAKLASVADARTAKAAERKAARTAAAANRRQELGVHH
jgi:hypothetical protein